MIREKQIDPMIAWKLNIIPAGIKDEKLLIYFSGNKDPRKFTRELEFLLETEVCLEQKTEQFIQSELRSKFPRSSEVLKGLTTLEEIIEDAISLNASDIHIERTEHSGKIRYRLDGKLMIRKEIASSVYPALINRIKIKSNLDISEKRLPQDGRFFITTINNKVDLRVSVMPSLHGEMAVIRILGNKKSPTLESIGMTPKQQSLVRTSLSKPQGLILISGPTGAGKTTTLYSFLNELNRQEAKILTVEDPIEFTVEHVNQVQVKPEIGLNFSECLRAFLRQDPDIIMLGEIRDAETAELAVRASLTGHLVISTIHTNSAIDSIIRLKDLGVPPYLICSTLTLSLAQRLVRLLCTNCRISLDNGKFRKGQGCHQCNMTGFKGRTGVYEILEVNDTVRKQIAESLDIVGSESDANLRDSVLRLVETGSTSAEEVHPLLLSFDK
jgi:type IV pilus assembly protein PilB